jgi:hypothetical protein
VSGQVNGCLDRLMAVRTGPCGAETEFLQLLSGQGEGLSRQGLQWVKISNHQQSGNSIGP